MNSNLKMLRLRNNGVEGVPLDIQRAFKEKASYALQRLVF